MIEGAGRQMQRSLAKPEFAGLRVAYLINQYPKVSHTFIRREILAAERLGVSVRRIALRGWDAKVVDAQDRSERDRTRYVLKEGFLPLLGSVLRTLARNPRGFLRAAGAAFAMGRRAVRPMPYHLIWLAYACRIHEWLAQEPVSHVHAHFGTNAAETALLLRLLGGPTYSFTAHGADEADDAARLSLDRKIAGAKFVAAISSYTRSQLLRHIPPGDWPKVRVVHCGLAANSFAGADAGPPEAPRFLCIGRLCGEKGHLILLDAFARLVEQYPGARLVLAGDGELRPLLEERIRALKLGPQVHITGWIGSAEVRAQILGCRTLVQPSLQEGLPVVIMEAMALRRPVISTYVAGIPELVLPGENGWLVPAGNVEALTDAMAQSVATPTPDLRRMGAAAQRRARDRHSIDTEAGKLAALFAAPV